MKKNPFNDVEARNWLFDTVNINTEYIESYEGLIFILGSGPFDQIELASFFTKYFDGMECYTESMEVFSKGTRLHDGGYGTNFFSPSKNGSRNHMIVVVGVDFPKSIIQSLLLQDYFAYESENFFQKYWFEFKSTLKGTILAKSTIIENVSIISQEMFLARLLRRNHFHHAEEPSLFLNEHEKDHNALQYCLKQKLIMKAMFKLGSLKEHVSDYFKWPSADPGIDAGGSIDNQKNWRQEGLLSNMGYRVGKRGLYKSKRRDILRDVFKGAIPNVGDPDYMLEWGRPDTSKRLCKLANTLAALSRGAKRKESDMSMSIQDWDGDLGWLKETFYDGVYDGSFTWPSKDIE